MKVQEASENIEEEVEFFDLQETLAKVSDFGNHDEDRDEYGPAGRGL